MRLAGTRSSKDLAIYPPVSVSIAPLVVLAPLLEPLLEQVHQELEQQVIRQDLEH
jgi:hypothetical protein